MQALEKQSNTEINIPDEVLNLYKIDGYENVAYKKYLISKKLFESEKNNSGHGSLSKTKDSILRKSGDEMVSAIIEALESSDIEIQRIGASLVQNAPKGQIEILKQLLYKKIVEALDSVNVQIQRIAMNMVQFVPENKQDELREIVHQKIVEGLNSDDVITQRIMAKKVNIAPLNTHNDLRKLIYTKIVKALNSDDVLIQRLAATTVQYAPKNKQSELIALVRTKFNLAKQEGRFSEIVESPLYMNSDVRKNSTFSREDFSKTGSDTTLLLGKQFRNNLIIRHIEEPCFSSWRKAYESYEAWMEAGFDYVPVEPIYSFKHEAENGLVNVSSGVLDLNLEDWYAFSENTFKGELDEQKNKIINAISSMGINHGHINDANFCLRFYRDENGNIDINQVPKIYLIDFDKATQY